METTASANNSALCPHSELMCFEIL